MINPVTVAELVQSIGQFLTNFACRARRIKNQCENSLLFQKWKQLLSRLGGLTISSGLSGRKPQYLVSECFQIGSNIVVNPRPDPHESGEIGPSKGASASFAPFSPSRTLTFMY